MINVQQKNYYSEVYGVLNMLGSKYIEKLPKQLYQLIDRERNRGYNPVYNAEIDMYKQNITNQALAMIMLFHLNYWCENEQEKEQLKKILKILKRNKNLVDLCDKFISALSKT